MKMLTKHFSLEELTTSGIHHEIGNQLPGHLMHNIQKLADALELARASLDGVSVMVTYGYRNGQLNRACGGSDTSAHCEASAADIRPSGWQLKAAFDKLCSCPELMSIVDQIILERGCIHIGLALARRQYMPRHEIRGEVYEHGVRRYPLIRTWEP